jgi:hypothetical protein
VAQNHARKQLSVFRVSSPIQSNGDDDEHFIRIQLAAGLKWENSGCYGSGYMSGMETVGIYTDTMGFIGNASPSGLSLGIVYVSHTPCVYS